MKHMFWSIAIPLIFYIIMFLLFIIGKNFCYCSIKNKKDVVKSGLLFSSIMTAPVLLEELYAIWLYKHIGLDIYKAISGTGGMLITLAIVLGIVSIVYLFALITNSYLDNDENEFGAFCTEFILLLFGIAVIFMCRSFEQDEKLKTINYKEVNQYEIILQPIDGDTNNTYIKINSQNNEIYYSTYKENGALIQDKMSYNSSTFDIFQDNNETPRINVITYGRQLKAPNGDVLREEYYDMHIIYIPEGKYNGNIE